MEGYLLLCDASTAALLGTSVVRVVAQVAVGYCENTAAGKITKRLRFLTAVKPAAVQKNTVKPAANEITCACITMTTVITGTTQRRRAFRALLFWTPRTEI